MPSSTAPITTAATTFPLFSLLPGELQNLIWEYAATSSGLPSIHFLRVVHPRFPHWIDSDLYLVPDHHSSALSLVHISLACRDAHAAVVRRDAQAVPHRDPQNGGVNYTVLRISQFEALMTMNLKLDLAQDVIVLGSVKMPSDFEMAYCDDWSNPVFSSARRVGILHNREGTGFHFWEDVARALRRFEDLREVYLFVDRDKVEGSGEGEQLIGEEEEMDVQAMEVLKAPPRRTFRAYGRTYSGVEGPERRGELRGEVAALHIMRASLIVDDGYSYRPPWASTVCFGLLSWREGI
ncbi:hypothetical protein B0T16DRAFT_491932 [Cercophora newfieldiana]|uniref:Uncharacterized protein n=1 Tax=Cercophora newfieldiana TaxID=92897 RepID=A0AA39YAY3_9PEZI|nr:hypothetical protein B0T16DRAFT_491932 [Cercophora newfieldiana]